MRSSPPCLHTHLAFFSRYTTQAETPNRDRQRDTGTLFSFLLEISLLTCMTAPSRALRSSSPALSRSLLAPRATPHHQLRAIVINTTTTPTTAQRSFSESLLHHQPSRTAPPAMSTMQATHGHSEACCNIPPIVVSGYKAKGSYEKIGDYNTCTSGDGKPPPPPPPPPPPSRLPRCRELQISCPPPPCSLALC